MMHAQKFTDNYRFNFSKIKNLNKFLNRFDIHINRGWVYDNDKPIGVSDEFIDTSNFKIELCLNKYNKIKEMNEYMQELDMYHDSYIDLDDSYYDNDE